MTRPGGPAATAAPAPPASTATRTLARWTAGLRYGDVPARVRAVVTSQVLSYLAAVRASAGHPVGRALLTAYGPLAVGPGAAPDRAAHLMAALSSSLYLEDTLYAGHVSHAAVGVPVAHQASQGLTGRALLTAVTAADESAGRVTAAATLGPFRGQWASHTHLVAACAALLRGAGADAGTLVDAWGLALSAPPRALRPALLASDAKVLSAAAPVRTAIDACAAACAGLTGRDDLIEHPEGLLAVFSGVAVPELLTHGLGTRWHSETLSFKLLPAGVHLDALIECAADLHRSLRPAGAADVAAVDVAVPRMTAVMSRHAEQYVRGAASPLSALNLGAPYNVATALLTGGLTVADLAGPRLAEEGRWELAGRVRLHADDELSRAAIGSTAPVGETLRHAGARALDWRTELPGLPLEELVAELGPPADSFEDAAKKLGCRMTVRMRDGREETRARAAGTGAVGSASWRRHPALVRDKLLRTGAEPAAVAALERLETLSARELGEVLGRILHLTD
ncbi:MmgE/PrpD family protein [Streptomyces apricus]|uniref:MmgE/PrpD family protein n=1 Tax=Streptomyces apricus TaxID=1828112 RepID=UPI00165EEE9E|nr:MmgE/PrpD family protein [Streptomyces apricus]